MTFNTIFLTFENLFLTSFAQIKDNKTNTICK